MPRPRTPVAKAKAAGADVKNPKRHEGRTAPKGTSGLGPASKWMGEWQVKAFDLFRGELPWLKESHRVLVELASVQRARMLDPEDRLSMDGATELRRCLAQLGATPADESKVNSGDGGEEDPDEALYQRPGSTH